MSNDDELEIYNGGDRSIDVNILQNYVGVSKRVVISQQWIGGKLMLRVLQDQKEIYKKENPNGKNYKNVKVILGDKTVLNGNEWRAEKQEKVVFSHLKISTKPPRSG